MTSHSRKIFCLQMSETKRVEITSPRFSFLTAADLSQKDDFEQLFNFKEIVISECAIDYVRPGNFDLYNRLRHFNTRPLSRQQNNAARQE